MTLTQGLTSEPPRWLGAVSTGQATQEIASIEAREVVMRDVRGPASMARHRQSTSCVRDVAEARARARLGGWR
jgi:hypothetical protein